jgi:PHD/YefM family antitoxin component YafN of YafNO toxin-antitoxin module
MLKLHPNVLKKNGRKEFVVLPYHEYEQIQELLQDAYDVRMLRAAKRKEGTKPSIPLAEAKKRLGL